MCRLVVVFILLSYVANNFAIMSGNGQYPNKDDTWNMGILIMPVRPSTNACPIMTLSNIVILPDLCDNQRRTITKRLAMTVPNAKNLEKF